MVKIKCGNCGQEIKISANETSIYDICLPDITLRWSCACGNSFLIECAIEDIREDIV
ncbi:MAG: hypothetical protein ACOCQR_02285 [bacterium]